MRSALHTPDDPQSLFLFYIFHCFYVFYESLCSSVLHCGATPPSVMVSFLEKKLCSADKSCDCVNGHCTRVLLCLKKGTTEASWVNNEQCPKDMDSMDKPCANDEVIFLLMPQSQGKRVNLRFCH